MITEGPISLLIFENMRRARDGQARVPYPNRCTGSCTDCPFACHADHDNDPEVPDVRTG